MAQIDPLMYARDRETDPRLLAGLERIVGQRARRKRGAWVPVERIPPQGFPRTAGAVGSFTPAGTPNRSKIDAVGLRGALRRAQTVAGNVVCWWCACILPAGDDTIDHLTPVSKGGTDKRENCVLACAPCNQRRGNRIATQAERWPSVWPSISW